MSHDDHDIDLGFHAEGITVEGKRLTIDEAEAFLTEATSMLRSVRREADR